MNKYLLIIFIFLVVLAPNINIIPMIPAVRMEDLVLIILLIYYVFNVKKQSSYETLIDPFNKSFFIIGFVAIFSVIFQELFYNRTIILSDMMIFPMIIKYICIYEVSKLNLRQYGCKPFLTALTVSIFISSAVGILQYHNILQINTWLTPKYSIDFEVQALIEHDIWCRAVGTIGNPQKFGQVLIFCISICISNILAKQHTLFYGGILFFLIWAIIYTLSRTAMITLLIVIIISFLITRLKKVSVMQLFKYLLILFIIVVLLSRYFALTQGFENRIMQYRSQSYKMSQHARIRDFKKPFFEIYQNPVYLFFGKGPSKDYIKTSMHNDFSWMLERYGVFAFIAYIFVILKCIRTGIRYYKTSDEVSMQVCGIIILNVFISWLCFAFAEDVFKDPKIMPINLIFLGLTASLHPNEKKIKSNTTALRQYTEMIP